MKVYSLLIKAILVLSPLALKAWELDQKSEMQPSIYYRQVPQKGFTSQEQSVDFFFRGGSQLRWTEGSWQVEVKPELYGFTGDSKISGDTDPYLISTKSPDRFMNLRHKINMDDEWYLELEKFNFSYNNEELEITIGRKPVSLGILKVFPVWNKFSKPLPITIGPATVLSSDTLSLRYQDGSLSYSLTSIAGSKEHEAVHFAGMTSYATEFEIHALIGQWWKNTTLGLAFAKDVWGATWRFETLFYEENIADQKRQEQQTGFGVEYAFNDKLSMLSEFLIQSNGAKKLGEYVGLAGSRFRMLKAQGYNFTQVQYKLTSLLTTSVGVLINGVDGSHYDILKMQYSYSDNTDLFAEVNIPQGKTEAEFSRKAWVAPNGFYRGAPTQASIGFKYIF